MNPDHSHWALLFSGILDCFSCLLCELLLKAGVFSSAAKGERTHALPQAAECPDRPGLPQTQTGRVASTSPSDRN